MVSHKDKYITPSQEALTSKNRARPVALGEDDSRPDEVIGPLGLNSTELEILEDERKHFPFDRFPHSQQTNRLDTSGIAESLHSQRSFSRIPKDGHDEQGSPSGSDAGNFAPYLDARKLEGDNEGQSSSSLEISVYIKHGANQLRQHL